MKDYLASIDKLRRDASEAALIRDLATNPAKREMFDRLCQHLDRLADEVEKAMNNPRDSPSPANRRRRRQRQASTQEAMQLSEAGGVKPPNTKGPQRYR